MRRCGTCKISLLLFVSVIILISFIATSSSTGTRKRRRRFYLRRKQHHESFSPSFRDPMLSSASEDHFVPIPLPSDRFMDFLTVGPRRRKRVRKRQQQQRNVDLDNVVVNVRDAQQNFNSNEDAEMRVEVEVSRQNVDDDVAENVLKEEEESLRRDTAPFSSPSVEDGGDAIVGTGPEANDGGSERIASIFVSFTSQPVDWKTNPFYPHNFICLEEKIELCLNSKLVYSITVSPKKVYIKINWFFPFSVPQIMQISNNFLPPTE
jgi:hypothetical protein